MTEPTPYDQLDPDDEVTIDGIALLGEGIEWSDPLADVAETIDGAELIAELRPERTTSTSNTVGLEGKTARWRPPTVGRQAPLSAGTDARTLSLTVVVMVFVLCLAGSLFV